MTVEIISWIAVGAILLASAAQLVSRDWRVSLGALGLLYLAGFWLVIQRLSFVTGAAKLVTGWMVVAVLGMTRLSLPAASDEEDAAPPSLRWFRLALIAVIAFVAASITGRVEASIPGLGLQLVAGSLLLIGGGVIHLGVASNVLETILGLLTMLAGFEMIYAAVEGSILVAGLLAIVNLGLGLAGSYLLVAGTVSVDAQEEEQ